MLDQRRFANLPWGMVALIFAIALIGLATVYSATYTSKGPSTLYYRQLVWLAIGVIVMLLALVVDYHTVGRYAYVLYAVSLLLLILVMAIGRTGMGAQRWLAIGPFAFQPSELAKLSVTLALARYFAEDPKRGGYDLRDLAIPGVMVLIPLLLVLKQPDLGTSLIYPLIFFSMATVLRTRARSVLLAVLGIAVALPIAWSFLHEYQKERVVTFFSALVSSEKLDVQDAAWQTTQSKIAVGSGHIFGKGFLHGTQNQLGFVPFQHTDFPFAVWSEEHGFVGVSLLMALYMFVVLWALRIASRARDRFGALVAIGVAAMLFWHVAINMGMVLGLLPVVGVTLPLFSYGGSSVLANLIGVGLLLSISARRQGSPWEGLGGRG